MSSSICYMVVDDGGFDPYVDTRICLGTNEWQEISSRKYHNFIENDDLNCQEEPYPYACWQSATSAFGDELVIAFALAIGVMFFVSRTFVWNHKHTLHDRFQREGIIIQATISERLSEPVVVGANRDPKRSNSSGESHAYYYRDATQVLEFTNTRGETVVRKTYNDKILEDISDTNHRQSSTHRPEQQQQHPTTTPIYHLPDHPQSALHSDPGRLQSQLCGRLLCEILSYALCLGWAGYHISFLYAPVWRGVVRQTLFQICALPLTTGLGYWNGKKLFKLYEDEVLHNMDRKEVDPDTRPRRQIVWGMEQTSNTEPTTTTNLGDAANHRSVIGTTYVPTNNHPFEHVPDYYYEQWHETPSQPRRAGRGLVSTSGFGSRAHQQPELHTDGP